MGYAKRMLDETPDKDALESNLIFPKVATTKKLYFHTWFAVMGFFSLFSIVARKDFFFKSEVQFGTLDGSVTWV